MSQRVYVQLGKAGDIINLLPLLLQDAKAGAKSAMMVSKAFASVLDGCSYVDRVVFNGEPHELDAAMEQAKAGRDPKDIICCQVNGPAEAVRKHAYSPQGVDHATTESFLKESWRLAGRLGQWRNEPPLIFDQRDETRELQLKTQYAKSRRRLLLVFAGGQSSPFPYRDLLLELLRLKFGSKMNIVNLEEVRAERIYDLLGLCDVAHCLVTSDSAPLQLAYGSKVPVVALVNDRPSLWNGSVWRPRHICHIRYRDFPFRALDMLDAIDGLSHVHAIYTPPLIIHAWSAYEETDDNAKRRKEARESWRGEYQLHSERWIPTRIEVGAVGRDSSNSELRDSRRYPFVHDVLRLACLRAQDKDLICLTRCDTVFKPGITDTLLAKSPCFAYRRLKDPETHHPAVDLFCFTKEWWRAHQNSYPANMVMGIDAFWHRTLASLLRKYGAEEIKELSWRAHPKTMPTPKQVPKYIAHNDELERDFRKKEGIAWTVAPVLQQLLRVPLNRQALKPFGYNPSIIRHKGRLLMAYRYHEEHNASTSLIMAELDERFNVTNNRRLQVNAGNYGSVEDPRLFEWQGQLWLAYILSTWPRVPATCVQLYGRLAEGSFWTVEDSHQPKYGKNDGSGMEKNWLPLPMGDQLWFVYSRDPQFTLIRVDGSNIVSNRTLPPVVWPYGQIKGGTVPLPFGDKLISFFHSRLDNEPSPWRWRYYMGAAVFSPDLEKGGANLLTAAPLLAGSEEDDSNPRERQECSHRKPNVVFPGGAITVEDGWIVSIGINDCICGLVKVTPKDLGL